MSRSTQANSDETDVISAHEGGDVFTLIHHELNIFTNSVSVVFKWNFAFKKHLPFVSCIHMFVCGNK